MQAIFDATCTTGCHSGRNPSGGLDLSASASYRALVSVASTCPDRRLLVKPGEPEASLLYQKVTGVGACGGSQMPVGRPPLGAAQLATIAAWICGGASP